MTQAGAGAVADVACAFADAVASVQPVDTYTRTATAPVGAAATPRKQRAGLKPGEWDPAQGDVAREGIAKRSYLQDMWYCVAAVPDGGLKAGKLYEASSMGKQITYWQGAHLHTRTPHAEQPSLQVSPECGPLRADFSSKQGSDNVESLTWLHHIECVQTRPARSMLCQPSARTAVRSSQTGGSMT